MASEEISVATQEGGEQSGVRRKAAGWAVKFLIGMPYDNKGPASNAQGQIASDWEVEMTNELMAEQKEFGDILPLAQRETYRDLGEKTFQMLDHGYHIGAQNILKIDVDMCPMIEKLKELASETDKNNARYTGNYVFNGDEYKSMYREGQPPVPYMSGVAYVFSRALAKIVTVDMRDKAVWWASWGTLSEDTNAGRWYQYAKEAYEGKGEYTFTRKTKSIARNLENPDKGHLRLLRRQ